MFGRHAAYDAKAQLAAINRSHAVIEFTMDGIVSAANEKFLTLLGYELDEIKGRHHSLFLTSDQRESDEYKMFWASLKGGECLTAEYKRIGKDGREVWIEATYNPILDQAGKPAKIVKVASDISHRKHRSIADSSKVSAINRAQAMIEFDLDGTILAANENFLRAMGYSLSEIRGKHHSMFVSVGERNTPAYRDFWSALNRGEFQTAEYKRIGKAGKEVWIIASYNPVFDETGRPVSVVKLATDITAQKLRNADMSGQIEAIGKSQAVIEFELDGTVINANDNFLQTLGYEREEIVGRHHSMFVETAENSSPAYREFWAALNHGKFQTGEFKRIGKGGKEVWIQACYNPILDLNGSAFKVVKYASDVTRQVQIRLGNERVRTMMESVAAGANELNASVCEISATMIKSKQTTIEAVERVAEADAQAKRLSDAAIAMSGIVELIGNITGQINLLALNATIESARAGAAGRGFAVVASEVKNLANQAKLATDQISSQIGGLNGISDDVMVALGSIKAAIQDVSQYVTSTAAAVEQQSAVTEEMSSSMHRAAEEAKALTAA